MSKLRHDPKAKMAPKQRAQAELLREPVLKMEPEEIDTWLDENVQTMEDARALFKKLILAVDALRGKVKI